MTETDLCNQTACDYFYDPTNYLEKHIVTIAFDIHCLYHRNKNDERHYTIKSFVV